MTDDLNRALAERLGWRIEHADPAEFDDDVWHVYRGADLFGHVFGGTIDEAWQRADAMLYEPSGGAADEQMPNWSGDAAAALALCEQIAREQGYLISLEFQDDLDGKPFASASFEKSNGATLAIATCATVTEALAQLALAALSAAPPKGGYCVSDQR